MVIKCNKYFIGDLNTVKNNNKIMFHGQLSFIGFSDSGLVLGLMSCCFAAISENRSVAYLRSQSRLWEDLNNLRNTQPTGTELFDEFKGN